MSLASIIISIATKEIAGFTVGGYLAEKAADVGTGKIWEELKKKIGDKTDTFEFRLYEVIEETVNDYFGGAIGRDISAAICEDQMRYNLFRSIEGEDRWRLREHQKKRLYPCSTIT